MLRLGRGFTGHEHLPQFGLINMNARLYDPVLGRFLSPDPYVVDAGYSQDFNRYSYARSNPLVYVDPEGEVPWLIPVIVGAVIGTYSGGVLANGGQYNPTKWDYSSGKTWGYMLGGAIVGGASGYLGWSIATSGLPMANTAGIAAASLSNSMGTHIYTGGKTDVSMSLGIASYNFTTGNWGYLGKKGNKWYENVGYGLGGLANISDVLAGFKPGSLELRTENDPDYNSKGTGKDLIGHSQLSDGNGSILIDWGPAENVGGFTDWVGGTNSYEKGLLIPLEKMQSSPLTISGINTARVADYANYLNKGGQYNILLNSCVSQTSRALNLSGVLNFGIHPYILQGQMYLRSIGFRPMLYSYYWYNR